MHLLRVKINSDDYPTSRCYPFNIPVLRNTSELIFNKPIAFFVGENGSGKSTLLEAIARRCSIHIWEGDRRARFRHNPHERMLYRYLQAEWVDGSVPGSFFAAEIFRTYSQIVDEWASTDPGVLSHYGDASLMEQSHGEGHLSYFRNRYRIKGLYLLDEPENALSPRRQMELLDLLAEMSTPGHAQFIITTHSPILMSLQGATIYDFNADPLREIAYEETDHFRTYREFLCRPRSRH